MRLTTSILQSLGCFGKTTTKNEHEPSNEMEKQSATSAETSKHGPLDQELTEQCIDTTSDDDLLQLIFDHLCKKLSVDYRNEYETVMSWNSSMQAIYMIWGLEAEVNNGGYSQFYYNSSGQYYLHLPEALRRVGVDKFIDLTPHFPSAKGSKTRHIIATEYHRNLAMGTKDLQTNIDLLFAAEEAKRQSIEEFKRQELEAKKIHSGRGTQTAERIGTKKDRSMMNSEKHWD